MHYTTSCNTQSSAPEDVQNNCPKYVELIGIINKPLSLHLVGCLYYLRFNDCHKILELRHRIFPQYRSIQQCSWNLVLRIEPIDHCNKTCRKKFHEHYLSYHLLRQDTIVQFKNVLTVIKPFYYFKLCLYTGLFIRPSGISELDCATTKTDTAERGISIGRESLQVFFLY